MALCREFRRWLIPECCCMWSNRRPQSTSISTSAPSSRGSWVKCTAVDPLLRTLTTSTPPICITKTCILTNARAIPPAHLPSVVRLECKCKYIWNRSQPFHCKPTCPPPSGNRTVSSKTTSYLPSTSSPSTARQATTRLL